MKLIFTALVAILASALFADGLPRVTQTDGKTEKITAFEVVVPKEIPLLKFAAEELSTYLGKVTASEVPVLSRKSGKAFAVVIGDCEEAGKAGLEVEKLAPEGYFIVRKGSCVYILGKDDPKNAPERNTWLQRYPRGTLNGVYDFLERFAGVRFFFPGEIGTVARKKGFVALPERIHIVERPDFISRIYKTGIGPENGRWYDKQTEYSGVRGDYLHLLRLRMSDSSIPYAHGLAHRSYDRRFGKTHPEYFALKTDGRRYITRKDGKYAPQLCFTSGILEEIYQDAKSYFKGEGAEVRGAFSTYGKFWSSASGGKYFSVMPHDSLYWCACPSCAKIGSPGSIARDEKNGRGISDYLWRFTADLANRLKKEGFRDARITQMVYMPMHLLPAFDLPDNIMIQIAVTGPGKKDQTADDEKLRQWHRKLNAKLNVWTYPGKVLGSAVYTGIPPMLARATGKYFHDRAGILNGVFYESETDEYIFFYLNHYMLCKITWDTSLDPDAILRDHEEKMFGAAAAPMREFFAALEELWLSVIGNTVDTNLGPVPQLPGKYVFWKNIYTEERLNRFRTLFRQAEKLAADDPESLARVRFMKEKMLAPILTEAEKYKLEREAVGSWECAIPGEVYLRPFQGDIAEVATKVTMSDDGDSYRFLYECEEPQMDRIVLKQRERDAAQLYADSCVELFLNPSGDRRNYFHFIVNTAGVLYDSKNFSSDNSSFRDVKWESGAAVKTSRTTNGWTAEIRVPKKALGTIAPSGFPVNFARHRALTEKAAVPYYHWNPHPNRGFHAIENFGVMKPAALKRKNLIPGSDFDVTQTGVHAGKWHLWKEDRKGGDNHELDKRIFITAGRSLRLENVTGKRINAAIPLDGVKPDTRYRFSFFIRTEDIRLLQKSSLGAGAFISANRGKFHVRGFARYSGTTPWIRECVEFTTPHLLEDRLTVGLWIWNATGKAWFDAVTLEEIPQEK